MPLISSVPQLRAEVKVILMYLTDTTGKEEGEFTKNPGGHLYFSEFTVEVVEQDSLGFGEIWFHLPSSEPAG